MIHRREALRLLAAGAAAAASPHWLTAQAQPKQSGLGLVIYCCRLRRQALQKEKPDFDLYEPRNFLEHCRRVGAGGMQAALGVRDQKYLSALRQQAEQHDLFLEAIVRPPQDRADVERFSAELETAKGAGALAVRTVVMPGRRYERFDSLAEFRKFSDRGRKMLELAAPVAEKHRIPLAVENHKDHRNDERIALFQHISSEYVGACVDTGNSFALLEDPIETVERLAPWAHSVHLKDQGLRGHEDGFLLADIPLGDGAFDLKKMVDILRGKKPKVRFSLELITRDPLKVTCLTEKFWATMPEVPGRDLARTLRMVNARAAEVLPQVSTLPFDKQVALEDAHVRKSLDYSREQLGL